MKLMERPGAHAAKDHTVPLYGPRPSSLGTDAQQTEPGDYAVADASTYSAFAHLAASRSGLAAAFERVMATAVAPPRAASTSAKRVEELHARTGLTWQQLARLFGVSRRAVHMWANGNRMSSTNLERLDRVETALAPLRELGPELARQALMSRRHGTSLYSELLHEVAEAQPRAEPRTWVDRDSVEES